jgi:hypothetical protein
MMALYSFFRKARWRQRATASRVSGGNKRILTGLLGVDPRAPDADHRLGEAEELHERLGDESVFERPVQTRREKARIPHLHVVQLAFSKVKKEENTEFGIVRLSLI